MIFFVNFGKRFLTAFFFLTLSPQQYLQTASILPYTTVTFFNLLFIFSFVPETKGRSEKDVQELFASLRGHSAWKIITQRLVTSQEENATTKPAKQTPLPVDCYEAVPMSVIQRGVCSVAWVNSRVLRDLWVICVNLQRQFLRAWVLNTSRPWVVNCRHRWLPDASSGCLLFVCFLVQVRCLLN